MQKINKNIYTIHFECNIIGRLRYTTFKFIHHLVKFYVLLFFSRSREIETESEKQQNIILYYIILITKLFLL